MYISLLSAFICHYIALYSSFKNHHSTVPYTTVRTARRTTTSTHTRTVLYEYEYSTRTGTSTRQPGGPGWSRGYTVVYQGVQGYTPRYKQPTVSLIYHLLYSRATRQLIPSPYSYNRGLTCHGPAGGQTVQYVLLGIANKD